VRILSLLPSATEMVYALGLEDDLVGVTHECDWPPGARSKPQVTYSRLPASVSPSEVDRLVSSSIGNEQPIYELDREAMADLRPDLVISQDLCAVCAVPSGHVNEALETLGCRAEVLSLDPSSLDDVLGCVLRLGEVSGTSARARALVSRLRDRLDRVRQAVARSDRDRVFALEWSDPPFNGGHWVPDMVEIAGGDPVLTSPGAPSVRVTWEQIAEAAPEIVVFMPCGYDLETAAAEAVALVDRKELACVRTLFAVDASSYFSRPGPRLVDGVEILAGALHPETVGVVCENAIRRMK
jgi:iron complex transport system substrate-binding protein